MIIASLLHNIEEYLTSAKPLPCPECGADREYITRYRHGQKDGSILTIIAIECPKESCKAEIVLNANLVIDPAFRKELEKANIL